MSNNTDLLEWYFAFLRKDAHLKSATPSAQFTPMALVKADQDLIEKIIEQDIASAAATDASIQKQKVSDTAPEVLNDKWLLIAVLISSAVGVTCLMLGLGLANYIALLALLACLILTAYLIRRKSQERKNVVAWLESRIVQSSNPLDFKNIPEGASTTELALEAVCAYSKQVESMQQKELLLFDYCPHILCELSEDGRILALNRNAGRAWGYETAELLNTKLEDLLMHGKDKFAASLERCQRQTRPENVEISTMSKLGKTVHLNWRNEWSASARVYFCIAEDISIQVEYERLKSEMSTMITHDLRAPISGLVFWTDNMLTGCYGALNEDAEFSLKQSKINLQSVLRLLDNLLAVDKLDSGGFKPNKTRVRVQDCFKLVLNQFGEWAKEAELKFEIQADEEIIAQGDLDQINRILTNFCSNAIKWSPAGTTVVLRASIQGDFAVLEVADSGPGISDEMRETLFQRWVMYGVSRTSTTASSGIGLYIAKRFAELQGGTCGARNGENGGSVFWFTLPLTKSS